jgi:hypothetical protein
LPAVIPPPAVLRDTPSVAAPEVRDTALVALPRARAARPADRISKQPPSTETPSAPPTVASAPAPTERSALAEETRLLREADRALRAGNAETALALVDEHATRFPDGVLAPERSAERLIALCQSGKSDAAAAARFLAGRASSPLAARVKQACGVR